MDVEDKHATQTSVPIPSPPTDEVDITSDVENTQSTQTSSVLVLQDTVLLIYILQFI